MDVRINQLLEAILWHNIYHRGIFITKELITYCD